MHFRNSRVTSLTFTETELILVTVHPDDGTADTIQRFPYGFTGLKNSGAVDNPAKMREFLEQLFIQNNFPVKTVLGIGLKYLDFKRLKLPIMPMDELQKIISDEATRESIFSFSNEQIAVSYCIGKRQNQPGTTTYDVLAATTPQEVINSYITTFESKIIQLLAIKPLLDGFRTTVSPIISQNGETSALVKLTHQEADFYVWQDDFPLFWRPLIVGRDEPERLQVEIMTSLEHFKRRATEQTFIEKLYIIGEKTPIELDGLKINYLDQSSTNDLIGLGTGFEQNTSFDFLHSSGHRPFNGFKYQSLGYILLILGLLGINIFMACNARTEWTRVKSLEYQLAVNRSQIASQKKMATESKQISSMMDWPLFLDELRRIVPFDLRFEKVEFGSEHPELTIEGLCMNQLDLNAFLKRLNELDYVKTVEIIDTTLQEHSGLSMIQFKLTVLMEADHEQAR